MKYRVPETLKTERLLLRQFEEEDWRDLHVYFSDPVATRYTFRRSLSEGETWRALCSMIGHWQLRKYGPYAVVEKARDRVIGICGFWFPNDWPEPEIKWALAREYWGQGFAREAALAVQEAGLRYMPETSLISFIDSGNQASIALAMSVGATLEKETEFRGGNWHVYRHPRAVS